MNKLYTTLLLSGLVVACGKKQPENNANKEAFGASSKVAKPGDANSLSDKSFVPDRVFFDYDSSSITPDATDSLKLQAEFLKSTKASIVVEGHADERGSDAYNLALGLKRAQAVKNLLVKHGLEAKKIKVVTFGKQKIEVPGDTEEAHSRNRRAVTVVVTK